MDLIAKLPCVAAKIYRNLYREGSSIGAIDSNQDWSANFANMLGYSNSAEFTELMRLYLTIHRYFTMGQFPPSPSFATKFWHCMIENCETLKYKNSLPPSVYVALE